MCFVVFSSERSRGARGHSSRRWRDQGPRGRHRLRLSATVPPTGRDVPTRPGGRDRRPGATSTRGFALESHAATQRGGPGPAKYLAAQRVGYRLRRGIACVQYSPPMDRVLGSIRALQANARSARQTHITRQRAASRTTEALIAPLHDAERRDRRHNRRRAGHTHAIRAASSRAYVRAVELDDRAAETSDRRAREDGSRCRARPLTLDGTHGLDHRDAGRQLTTPHVEA